MPSLLPSPPSLRGLPRAFWTLWGGSLLNSLGGFVVPFLTLYLTGERHLSVGDAGRVTSLWGLGSLVAGPLGGAFADRFGRRLTLSVAALLNAAAMLHLGTARAPAELAVGALALGFFQGLWRPSVHAIIADVVPLEDRPRAYGLLHWAYNLGFAVASVVAGLLARRSFAALFIGDAATTLGLAVLVWLRVPETRPARASGDGAGHVVALTAPFRDPLFATFVALMTGLGLLFQQGLVTLPVDMRAHGISEAAYGALIGINGVLIVVLQPLLFGVVTRADRSRVLAIAALLNGCGFGMTGLAGTPALYAASIVVWTLGEIVNAPVAPSVVADLSPPSLRGAYAGAFGLSFSVGAFVAPALGGLVLERLGPTAMWSGCALLGLLLAALHLGFGPAFRRRAAEVRALGAGVSDRT